MGNGNRLVVRVNDIKKECLGGVSVDGQERDVGSVACVQSAFLLGN